VTSSFWPLIRIGLANSGGGTGVVRSEAVDLRQTARNCSRRGAEPPGVHVVRGGDQTALVEQGENVLAEFVRSLR
jgi:hypothetical protein